ncbi:MAG: hypothetical protein PHU14_05615 [Methylovulum sp.]|nr:hypothetical protein [Methylovulum sp.]
MSQLDHHKIKYAVAVVLLGAIGAYFAKPLMINNQDAINVIVTVFSILAGFLVAIITLIGDPKSLPSGSWQIAELARDLTYSRLKRQKWLFYIYLTALALIFLSMLLKAKFAAINDIIEYCYLFFSVVAFILSFKLPSMLMDLQKERIEQEITERRRAENIQD